MRTAILLAGLLGHFQAAAAVGRACDPGSRPYSAWMTDSVIARQDAILNAKTEDDVSIIFKVGLFESTVIRLKEYYDADSCGQEDWHSYLLAGADSLIPRLLNLTGDITSPMDTFATGEAIYHQYDRTQNATYKQVLDTLWQALNERPRNSEGGFWFYEKYPNLSYLDESYPLGSFSSLWKTYIEPTNTTIADNLINDLDLLKNHCHHDDTGLLAHGYDASKSSWWANATTGASPYVWDRALGWYHMALVDLLENADKSGVLSQTQRDDVYTKYYNLANTIINDADNTTGCWWQVMEHGGQEGNYIETSGSSMFVYSLLKGARLGYLSGTTPKGTGYTDAAHKCYGYLVDHVVNKEADGTLGLDKTVSVCSLTTPTYEYYVSQPIDYNSVYGTAPFILASWEHEMFLSGDYP
ncbi:cell wall glycosyl hydrolase YteR [Aspergillus ellipticus CBS 707.79]|uniref:Cell wall glycosyl hydrolase YteR n=1 Tax=Aspergillus ellipticus CBS 707.79 TaxID=1448320 RepID=A0A319EB54_9EURO|nr:cell wall glycosyl hydrolase YteR [Aspergillus ellipticus CBS 707.79]